MKEATIMMEFGIINYKTGERDVMFGYNVMDAFKRSGKDMIDWVVEYEEFIDQKIKKRLTKHKRAAIIKIQTKRQKEIKKL